MTNRQEIWFYFWRYVERLAISLAFLEAEKNDIDDQIE